MKEDASIYTGEKRRLGTVDYILFSLLFCSLAAIGFYHAYRDRKKKTTNNFQLGGGKMHIIPVSMSLSSTFLSALTLLGTPAEIYTSGTMFMWITVAMLIATAGAAHLFIPVFYQLKKVSCFEYIQLRFGVILRRLTSTIYLIQTLVYTGFVLYVPSLALAAVTGVSLLGTMVVSASVCTLYTTLGGMKTVVWTQSLLWIIRVGSLFCILIIGAKETEGFSNAWDIAGSNGRIKFDDFSADPKTRHSVWAVAIGTSFFCMYLYGINQAQVQQALSLPTLTRSKIAIWANLPYLWLVMILASFIGVVIYAFYSDCHPLTFGLLDRNDQLLPLFVLDIMGEYKGLSGIFLAGILSASLGTISSGLNAISAIVFEDFIKPISSQTTVRNKGILMSKAIVFITGCVHFAVAVAISEFEGLVLQFAFSMYSILAGPILGIFVAGMFLPWTNQPGTIVGFIVAIALMCWLGLGNVIERPPNTAPKLPLYTHGCILNATGMGASVHAVTTMTSGSTTAMTATTEEPIIYNFYRISYMWYTCLGMIFCVVTSLIVSFLTGYTKPDTIDSRLLCPFIERICLCAPERIKKPIRFGINYDNATGDVHTNSGIDNVYVVDDDIQESGEYSSTRL